MKTRNRVLLLILSLVTLLFAAPAFAAGSSTFGDLVVRYFTNGKTEVKIVKGNQILFYAVLTSAQTSTLRGTYTDVRTASGGLTAGTYDAMDGTDTLPQDPIWGDLTD